MKVQIFTAGPRIDHPIIRKLSRHSSRHLLQAGAEIFEYQPSMIHAKLMTVDGQWNVAGSTNFDHRSFALNDEVIWPFSIRSWPGLLKLTFSGFEAKPQVDPGHAQRADSVEQGAEPDRPRAQAGELKSGIRVGGKIPGLITMKTLFVVDETKATVIGHSIAVADTSLSRFLGLMESARLTRMEVYGSCHRPACTRFGCVCLSMWSRLTVICV